MEIQMVQAVDENCLPIWNLLQQGIERRRKEGSNQWQDGYPNIQTVENDLKNGFGFVFKFENEIIGYAALIYNYEPAYDAIKGKWLSDDPYFVIHRLCIDESQLGKGLATKFLLMIENYVSTQNCNSIKVDTNFDNAAMLRIFEKLNYKYCGEVELRGSSRKAFQKVF